MNNVSKNSVNINGYFFEMDNTNFNIHVYWGDSYVDIIEVHNCMPYDVFKQSCNDWLIKNR